LSFTIRPHLANIDNIEPSVLLLCLLFIGLDWLASIIEISIMLIEPLVIIGLILSNWSLMRLRMGSRDVLLEVDF